MGYDLLLGLLGGLALFLYGMQMMSTSLEAAAGNQMKQILERLTKNRYLSVLVGAGITALIQSSSATTVMTIGFVNSGLMSLRQAVWIIMGANVGTTITSQLVALDVGELAPLIAFIGVVMLVFSKKKHVKNAGGIIAGIGVLFIGMNMMSEAMMPLRDSKEFIGLVTHFKNPLVGILVGALFTAAIQSSAASIGILQALAMGGVINIHTAVFVLFGQNIGTCITALIASVGTSQNAKRTTAVHLMFNVFGTIIFVVLCLLTPFTDWMEVLAPGDPVTQIANVHTIFNITTTLILLPFDRMLERAAIFLLPDKDTKAKTAEAWYQSVIPSKHHLGISTIAINQIRMEIADMLDKAGKNVSESFHILEEGMVNGKMDEIEERENEIDIYNMRLSEKISKILVLEQTPEDVNMLSHMYNILGNIERIGDHAMNLAEYAQTIDERGLVLSGEARQEFSVMEQTCAEGLILLKKGMGDVEGFELGGVELIEQKIDDYTSTFRQNQISRMRESSCSVESSILYSEMLTDYERIGDHMLNIGEAYAAMAKGKATRKKAS